MNRGKRGAETNGGMCGISSAYNPLLLRKCVCKQSGPKIGPQKNQPQILPFYLIFTTSREATYVGHLFIYLFIPQIGSQIDT
jgi:hypothetical protein